MAFDKNNDLEGALEALKFDDRLDHAHRDRLEAQLRKAFNQQQRAAAGPSTKHWNWRIIMQSKATRYSAAAAVIMAAAIALVLTVFNTTVVTPAYALEQTVQANRDVRTVHLLDEGGRLRDAWAQFDDQGNLEYYRGEFPNEGEDGPKVVIWHKDKAEIWFKAKKSVLVIREPNALAKLPKGFFDPKQRIDDLYQAQAAGKIKIIQTQEPSKEGEMICLSVDSNDPNGNPAKRTVFLVDPNTKLLNQVVTYQFKDDKYELSGRTTYLEYNKPIDPSIFKLDLPSDVMRIDQTIKQVGLAKGNLSDNDIAKKVAKEFFEALITGNYEKAGNLYEGIPAERLKKGLEGVTFTRIVSIGEPYPHPIKETHFLVVPSEVEMSKDNKTEVQTFKLNIRAVYNQPEYWEIGGGF